MITIDLYADPPNDSGKVILHCSVTDNGLGMSEAEQQKLFQRFSQANRKCVTTSQTLTRLSNISQSCPAIRRKWPRPQYQQRAS